MKANRYYVHFLHVRQMVAGFVLILLATNATISCKILVKIGPVIVAEMIIAGTGLEVEINWKLPCLFFFVFFSRFILENVEKINKR